MGGANYMGGKRNFAKARSKDAMGKAQRNHFGKQRLGILTRGLSKVPLELSKSGDSVMNAASRISLAHAKPNFQIHSMNAHSSDGMPSFHVQDLGTPSSSRRLRSPDRSSSVSGKSGSQSSARTSKFLKALDVSVPISLRAEMDRIRSIPNLAGLAPKAESRPHFLDYEDVPESARSSPLDLSGSPWFKKKMALSPSVDLRNTPRTSSPVYNDVKTLPRFTMQQGATMDQGRAGAVLFADEEEPDFIPFYLSDSPLISDTATQRRPQYINQLEFTHLAHTEPDFEPMLLDSSPPVSRCFDDSRSSGFLSMSDYSTKPETPEWKATRNRFQPTRHSHSRQTLQDWSPVTRGPCAGLARDTLADNRSRTTSFSASPMESGPHFLPFGYSRSKPLPWFSSGVQVSRDSPASASQLVLRTLPPTPGHVTPDTSHETRRESDKYITSTSVEKCLGEEDPDLSLWGERDLVLSAASIPHSRSWFSVASASQSTDSTRLPILPAGSKSRLTSPLPIICSGANIRSSPCSVDVLDDAIVQEESLYDALHGQLFEGADPWRVLDGVLGLSSEHSYEVHNQALHDSVPHSSGGGEINFTFNIGNPETSPRVSHTLNEAPTDRGIAAASASAELKPVFIRDISPPITIHADDEGDVEESESQLSLDIASKRMERVAMGRRIPKDEVSHSMGGRESSSPSVMNSRAVSSCCFPLSQETNYSDILHGCPLTCSLQAESLAEASWPGIPKSIAELGIDEQKLTEKGREPNELRPATIEGPCLFVDDLLSDEE